MPNLTPLYTSLNAGELSPLLEGRVDFQKYAKGLKVCENFIPLVQGPLTRRPGTYFVAEIKNSANRAAVVRFEFSTTQAYIIEFGDLYMRFYRNEAQILSGGVPYEVATPYTLADLFDANGALRLKFAQSADVLYVAHPSYAPRKVSRTGHTSWTISTITFLDGPYLATNTTATTLTPSATTGSVTITASAATFAATDVGRQIRIKHSNLWGYATITAFTSTTQVTATVNRAFGATTASVDWRLGLWSATTGYPAAVSFYGDRLFWGGSTSYPQRIDGSVVGAYETMEPTSFVAGSTTDNTVIADDDALALTLNANDVNVIKSIGEDEQGLIVFTVGGEWIVRPSNQNEALTPTNIRATRSTAWGCAEPQPVRVGKPHIFVQRAGRKVRELAYVFSDDGFRAPDLSIASEHITRSGIVAIAYQAQPQTIVWFVRADGVLIGMTYDRDQEAIAWHRHTLGGAFGAGAAVVESAAVIPNSTGTADQLWLIVKRTINGATRRYVEYLTAFFDETTAQADAHFVDSGLRYSGAPASVFSGLSHLEGQTVAILADGAARPDAVVNSGSVSLSRGTASTAVIGLGYASNMQTERLEFQSRSVSTVQTKKKRIHEISARVWRTLGGKSGPDASTLELMVFRSTSDPMDSAPPLTDGDIRLSWPGGYETEGRIYIRQDQPLPMTILAIVAEGWTDA
jgi:hypothetical protein